MPFPLPFIPKLSYMTGGRRFGAPRDSGRKHAGCDLIAPAGTEIFAVADGVVIEPVREFYHNHVKALVVRHPGFVARYCEIRDAAPGIKLNSEVKAGQVVAFVGQMFHAAMLHFEVYAGSMAGPLTVRSNKPFQRRGDIIDPTALLGRLASHVLESHEGFAPNASAGGVE